MRPVRLKKPAAEAREGDYLETTVGDRDVYQEITFVRVMRFESGTFGGRTFNGETMVTIELEGERCLLVDGEHDLCLMRVRTGG